MKLDVLLKWTLLVWMNAAISFWLSLGQYPQTIDRFAIVLGVFTFIVLYAKIDIHLLSVKKFQLRKALLIGVVIKALLQIYPFVEISTGMVSTAFIERIIGKVTFISAYFITVTDGLLLSMLVAAITGLINFVMNKSQKTNPVH